MEENQEKMIVLMKEILQDEYLHLVVRNYTLVENLEEGTCRIACHMQHNGHELAVEGVGVGAIDALFNGLKERLADQYPSLRSIRFSQFMIEGLISSDDGVEASKAEARATVGIYNSEGVEFVFRCTSPSVSQAGIQATAEAAEYFINSEKTFVRLHEILEHYRSDGRTDLVEKYTELMSRVVRNTSYSDVVEKIRQSL